MHLPVSGSDSTHSSFSQPHRPQGKRRETHRLLRLSVICDHAMAFIPTIFFLIELSLKLQICSTLARETSRSRASSTDAHTLNLFRRDILLSTMLLRRLFAFSVLDHEIVIAVTRYEVVFVQSARRHNFSLKISRPLSQLPTTSNVRMFGCVAGL